MIKIDLEQARKVFDKEVALQKDIVTKENKEDAAKRIEQIDKKVIHTNEVINDGILASKVLGFNESNLDFSHICLMNHDIGRFEQMRITGSYRDNELLEQTGIKDHGVLGRQVLDRVIDEQLPNCQIFYDLVKTVVENHVSKKCDLCSFTLLSSKVFSDYSLDEIIKSSDETQKQDVENCITQIVQDVDRLDIYHQILSERWTPMKSETADIDSKVFDMYYQGQYLNMAELKANGLWNCNVGELVRLGFINQIRLLSVAKVIKDEDIIIRLKEKRNNPKAKDAFDIANERLNQMIENSEDGVIVGKIKTL